MSGAEMFLTILLLLVWIGVAVAVLACIKDIYERWLKRKRLTESLERIHERLSSEEKALHTKLQEQNTEINHLRSGLKEYAGYVNEIESICQKSMKEMAAITHQIVDSNESLQRKLKQIDKWVDKEKLSPEFRSELLNMLRQDVSFKQQYEAALDQYNREMDERVRQRSIKQAKSIGWEREL